MTLPPIERIRFEVWALAWPVILSFGLDSILGLSSMLMVGRLGADAVGAVGLATQILGAVRAGIAAVGTGTVALVARYIGANDRDSAEEVLRQSVVFGVLVSTIIAIPVIVFARPLMGLFQVHGEMADMGARYLQVVMLSEPFQGIFLMCASALRGAGDTRTPLWIGGIIDVLAIFLNYVLIFGKLGMPALGVDGSAVATLLAIAFGGILFFYALSIDGMVLNFRWRGLWPDFGLGRRILSVGNPAAIEQLLIQFGFVAYVGFIARYGAKEIAAYFIGVRILALSFLPGFGFSAASATLVGQGLGAGDPEVLAQGRMGIDRDGDRRDDLDGRGVYRLRPPNRRAFHRRQNRHRVHGAVHVRARRRTTADGDRLDHHRCAARRRRFAVPTLRLAGRLLRNAPVPDDSDLVPRRQHQLYLVVPARRLRRPLDGQSVALPNRPVGKDRSLMFLQFVACHVRA